MFERIRTSLRRRRETADHAQTDVERGERRGADDDLMIPRLGRISPFEEVHGKVEQLVDDGRPR